MPQDNSSINTPNGNGDASAGAVARITARFRRPDGSPDALRCGQLLAGGAGAAGRRLLDGLGDGDALPATAHAAAAEIADWKIMLTGAETVAVLLAEAGVSEVFVYAGTSELALCDAVDQASGIRVVNGRGDKESAFMAAGASLLKPNVGAAILHGARGFTNAAGAVADARRNEAGTVYVVGLPSTGSTRFLPPHGEADLSEGMSAFASWSWEAPPVPDGEADRRRAAHRFVAQVRHALASVAQAPHRPALVGVPQDVAEQRWIDVTELTTPPAGPPAAVADEASIEAAVRVLRSAERPLILIDDYALRHDGVRAGLDRLSQAVGAPVLQVRYRRGPMLFERLRTDEVTNFAGWLNQFSAAHMDLLNAADLLVTVEDRNMYERVVGRLPRCTKIAINTDPEKVLKNEYLGDGDTMLVGTPGAILDRLADRLADRRPAWFPDGAREAARVTPEPATAEVAEARGAIVGALAGVLREWHNPVLIDDSQMFGGLISESYDELPAGLRVFGGHGGFVGGGLPIATGLAIARTDVRVMCTLGDQAFTNSFQGLVAALQENARIVFVVCNNGESVSLKKQAAASYETRPRHYLSNVSGMRYRAVAEALGVAAERVAVPIGGDPEEVRTGLTEFSAALRRAAQVDGPSLVELVLPSDPAVWRGIWLTQGFEQIAPAAA
ncbi:acetolactate synthase [Actinoplanes cyaneus]|uniref:Acetolactate synthase n=1 Tax=Actinoplanes cyaneus TaxID=52696 RepID=A0A919MCC3_9ACTN|nr:thiamine pyrophosphate-binding protein [Actinoplanes cyaneus]MCW2138185.1 Acetolactate synthase large subunit [Actinoplanes cyaneus]GID70519.1 acetolactate synthase [Actinoplanes cyaneus]